MAKKTLRPPDSKYFDQLRQGLLFDDQQDAEDGVVSPEEARRRSEAARLALEGRKVPTAWLSKYNELRDSGWPWRIACYIAWAASPKNDRWPKTQDELATQVLGLTSDRQIGTWRKKNPMINDVIGILQAAPLFEHRADIYNALIQSATSTDYKSHQDRKLALELLGDYVPRVKVDQRDVSDVKDLDDLSDEELEKLAGLGKPGTEEEPGE